jgi:hypothetical protein
VIHSGPGFDSTFTCANERKLRASFTGRGEMTAEVEVPVADVSAGQLDEQVFAV